MLKPQDAFFSNRRQLLAGAGAGITSLALNPASSQAASAAAGFPKTFVWGAATAAYQIEGGHDADGRGPSVWDMFSKQPNAVFEGHTGDVACDHYHRWREDVALMKRLGIGSYRFSVSWSRVLPEGRGKVNDKGLDFYKHLVDALLAAKITPACTRAYSPASTSKEDIEAAGKLTFAVTQRDPWNNAWFLDPVLL